MHDAIGSTDEESSERTDTGENTARHARAAHRRSARRHRQVACAFVLNRADGTVTIVRTSTKRVLPPIPVGEEPWGAAATPDGRRLYVSNAAADAVSVLDVARRTIVGDHRRRPLAARTRGDTGRPSRLRRQHRRRFNQRDRHRHQHASSASRSPRGRRHGRWRSRRTGAGRTSRTRRPTPSRRSIWRRTRCVATIAVGALPLAIAIAPDGRYRVRRQRRREYGDADRFMTAHGSRIHGGVGPCGRGGWCRRSRAASRAIASMRARRASRVGDLRGRVPCGIAITPDGRLLCVANSSSKTVTLIEAASLAVIAHIDLDDTPAGIAIAPDGRYAYVTLADVSRDGRDRSRRRARASVRAFRWARLRSVRRSDRRSSCRMRSSRPRRSSSDDDGDLTAHGFGRFVPFDGGALRLAGPWHTNRHLSLLTHGGWIDTNGFDAIVEGDVVNDGSLTKTGEGSLDAVRRDRASQGHVRARRHADRRKPSRRAGLRRRRRARRHGIRAHGQRDERRDQPGRTASRRADGGRSDVVAARVAHHRHQRPRLRHRLRSPRREGRRDDQRSHARSPASAPC